MSDIQARLRFDITQFQNALNQVRGEIKQLKATAKSSGQGLGASMFGPLKGAIAGLGMAKLASEVFDAVLRFDTLEKTLRVTEGSAEGAARRFAELREVGRNPGLSLEAAVKGDVRLRAVGMSAAQSTSIILEMGNALSLVGGSQEDLEGVLLALTQISSKGKVFAEEINQINERLPQVRTIMKNVFGTSVSEDIQKLNLDANDFIMRLVGGFSELDRAQPGLREDLTELGTIFSTLANDAFSPLIHEIIPGFKELATMIAENKKEIGSFGSTAGSAFKELAHLFGFANDLGHALFNRGEITIAESKDKVTTRKATFAESMQGLDREKKKTAAAAEDKNPDPFADAVKKPMAAASGASAGATGSSGSKKKPDVWKEADKQLKLQRQIADEQKKMAEDGLSVQDKVVAKQKEVDDAIKLESIIAKDGTAEAKLGLELKRVQLQRELNRLLEEQKQKDGEDAKKKKDQLDAQQKLNAEAARHARDQKIDYQIARKVSDLSLEELRLRIRGNDKRADKLARKKHVDDLEVQYGQQGFSPKEAMARAREHADLEDKLERRRSGRAGHIYGVRGEGKRMGSEGNGGLKEYDRLQKKHEIVPGVWGHDHFDPLSGRGPGGRRSRWMGGDEGSLSDRAVRGADAQDQREKQDNSGKDIAAKLLASVNKIADAYAC